LPISDKYVDYAKEVEALLKEKGIRVEVDMRGEKLGYKIREAQLDKVPYMIILGEKEQNSRKISVRSRDGERDKQDLGEMSVEEFVKLLSDKNEQA
ncbi:MAG: threonine--tRNA ligase, partial [Lachnospiraceae bacterium]|nr:threonine--tRNA ligase [Lachnospiraceae bacterium]